VQALFLWSKEVMAILLQPQALELYLRQPYQEDGVLRCAADPAIAGYAQSEVLCRRLAWLSCNAAARRGWGSVYSNALNGRIDLDLPPVGLAAWAWGQTVGNGLLACELMGVELQLPLPQRRIEVVVAGRTWVAG